MSGDRMAEKRTGAEAQDLTIRREYFNRRNADYREQESRDSSNVRRAETVIQLLESLDLSNPDIVDVGCANGWLSAKLAHFGTVTGVDLADEAIAVARTRYPHNEFISGNFLTLDLPVGHFDLAVSVDVISYVEDQLGFVEKIALLLKPGGHLILMCPHKFVWDRTDFVRRSHGEIPLLWLNMRNLKKLLHDHFLVLHSETILPAGNQGILRLINSYRLNGLIQKVVPEPYIVRLKERTGLGKTLVVVARKRT